MSTFTSFVAAVAGITITGVTAKTSPPVKLDTAELPCSYPLLPTGGDTTLVFGNGSKVGGNQPNYACEMVYVFEAVGQSRQPENFSGCLTLMDSVVTASRALTRPTDGPMSYTLRLGIVSVAGNDYWAVVQSWEGVG